MKRARALTCMVRLSSVAWMLTSSAEPIAPPAGWCIITRVLGIAKRLPLAPAAWKGSHLFQQQADPISTPKAG